jgi:hypothetical protein
LKRIKTIWNLAFPPPPSVAISSESREEPPMITDTAHPASTVPTVMSTSSTEHSSGAATANVFSPLPVITSPGPQSLYPGSYFWSAEAGVFALTLTVTKAENIIHHELDNLAITKWRLSQTSTSDRWYPVLQRYVAIIEKRVDGLSQSRGLAGRVPASPDGAPIELQWPDQGYGGPYGGDSYGNDVYGE